MSATGSISEVRPRDRDVCSALKSRRYGAARLGQKSANKRLMHRNKQRLYSITSSASCKNDSRSERPRALAVLRLTTSSNLTGDCAGKLPGGSPLRTRSTYEAERRKISAASGP